MVNWLGENFYRQMQSIKNYANISAGNISNGMNRISQQHDTTTEYYLADAQGSVRQLTDSTGTVVLAHAYDPYGNLVENNAYEGVTTAYGYAGEYSDPSGMVYLRARYYSPAQGRFVSKDVWEGDAYKPASYNAWLYVYANPLINTDPSGYEPLLGFTREEVEGANYWTEEEKYAAEHAALAVGKAFANTINSNFNYFYDDIDKYTDICSIFPPIDIEITPYEAFMLIYGDKVIFKQVKEVGLQGAYAMTMTKNKIKVYSNHTKNYAVDHPNWIIHELGHAFNKAVEVTTKPGKVVSVLNGLNSSSGLLKRKLQGVGDPFAGFAGGHGEYQFSSELTNREIFADMFIGWVRNSWAKNVSGDLTNLGQKRANFMNNAIILGIKDVFEYEG